MCKVASPPTCRGWGSSPAPRGGRELDVLEGPHSGLGKGVLFETGSLLAQGALPWLGLPAGSAVSCAAELSPSALLGIGDQL